MDYRHKIADLNALVKQYREKIKSIEAELDQLWRDEGVASIDHEVSLDWRGQPQPMLCHQYRKEPALVAKRQKQVGAIVNGQLAKVWQDYYLYDLANGQIWGKTCYDTY